MKTLLTGAGGFVGSHVLRHWLTHTDDTVVCPVTFRHQGKADRIASAIADHPEWRDRIEVVMHDLTAPVSVQTMALFRGCRRIINVASESHVDRSITEPGPFIANNVALMTNVLEIARWLEPDVLVQVSTDEVYGDAPAGHDHAEWEAIRPSNPYSASKACQEAIAFSYWRTYGVPLILTNTMNIVGEMQDPEKFVPMVMKRLLAAEPITVHVGPDGTPGSRFYLHARNQADAMLYLTEQVTPVQHSDGVDRPDRFNIVGEREVDNVEMVGLLAEIMGVEADITPVDFHSSRPGHDLRYALDGTKIAEHGWKAPMTFEESLERTVAWTLAHREWLL